MISWMWVVVMVLAVAHIAIWAWSIKRERRRLNAMKTDENPRWKWSPKSEKLSGAWISYSVGGELYWNEESSCLCSGSLGWESEWISADRLADYDLPNPTLRISEPLKKESG